MRGPFSYPISLLAACAAIIAAVLFPAQAFAAEEHGLPGASMPLWWALPFAGLLLSIATGPLLFPHVWEHHYGKISALWAALV
ncbi:sodium:proton antiporter, partial [Mesorhizobium sp. M7A.F.Ca.CA.004.12.1.1]